MRIAKIVFGLIAAAILGYLIAALASAGIHYLRSGSITSGGNLVVNSDLLSVVVEDTSGNPVALTQQNPVEMSIASGTPFEVSWQVNNTLAASNPVCDLVGYTDKKIQPEHDNVPYSGTLQVDSSVSSSGSGATGYTLQCMVGVKRYVKEVLVNF